MLLAGRGLDGRDDLAGDTQFRKRAEAAQPLGLVVADGLEQADHALLHDVLMVRSDEKIAARFGAHEVLVLAQQVLHGHAVALLRQAHDLLVGHVGKALVQHAFPGAVHLQSVALVRLLAPVLRLQLVRGASIPGFGHGNLTCLYFCLLSRSNAAYCSSVSAAESGVRRCAPGVWCRPRPWERSASSSRHNSRALSRVAPRPRMSVCSV